MMRVALILLSIALVTLATMTVPMTSTALAIDKDPAKFSVGAASSYDGHQTLDKITIAAVPYTSEDQLKTAFGKADPPRYGILPVLLVLENGTGKAIRLDLKAELITADGHHVESVEPDDVMHIGPGPKRPRSGPSPLPFPLPSRNKKGPLNTWEIPGRAFSPKLVPPGESASGFFYFYVDHEPNQRLYLNGIRDATTGKEFFYFEIPLAKP